MVEKILITNKKVKAYIEDSDDEDDDVIQEKKEREYEKQKAPELFLAQAIATGLRFRPISSELYKQFNDDTKSFNNTIKFYQNGIYGYLSCKTTYLTYLNCIVDNEEISIVKKKKKRSSKDEIDLDVDEDDMNIERLENWSKDPIKTSEVCIEEEEEVKEKTTREIADDAQKAFDSINPAMFDRAVPWCGLFGRFKNPLCPFLAFLKVIIPGTGWKNKEKRSNLFLTYVHMICFSFYLHLNNRFLQQYAEATPFKYKGVREQIDKQHYSHDRPANIFIFAPVHDCNDGSGISANPVKLKNFGDVIYSVLTKRYNLFFHDILYSMHENDSKGFFDGITLDVTHACVEKFAKNALSNLATSRFKEHPLLIPIEKELILTNEQQDAFDSFVSVEEKKVNKKNKKVVATGKEDMEIEGGLTEKEVEDKKNEFIGKFVEYEEELGAIDVATKSFFTNHRATVVEIENIIKICNRHPSVGQLKGVGVAISSNKTKPSTVAKKASGNTTNNVHVMKFQSNPIENRADVLVRFYSHIAVSPNTPIFELRKKDIKQLMSLKGDSDYMPFEQLLIIEPSLGITERSSILLRRQRFAYMLSCFLSQKILDILLSALKTEKEYKCGQFYDRMDNAPLTIDPAHLLYCHSITPRLLLLMPDEACDDNFQKPRFLKHQPFLSMIRFGEAKCLTEDGRFLSQFPYIQDFKIPQNKMICLSEKEECLVLKAYNTLIDETKRECFLKAQEDVNLWNENKKHIVKSISSIDPWCLYLLFMCILDKEEDVYATLVFLCLPLNEYLACRYIDSSNRDTGATMTPALLHLYDTLHKESRNRDHELTVLKRAFASKQFQVHTYKRLNKTRNSDDDEMLYDEEGNDLVYSVLREFKEIKPNSCDDLFDEQKRGYWMARMFPKENLFFFLNEVITEYRQKKEWKHLFTKSKYIKEDKTSMRDTVVNYVFSSFTEIIHSKTDDSTQQISLLLMNYIFDLYNPYIKAFLLHAYPIKMFAERSQEHFFEPKVFPIVNCYNNLIQSLLHRDVIEVLRDVKQNRKELYSGMSLEIKQKFEAVSATLLTLYEHIEDPSAVLYEETAEILRSVAPNFKKPTLMSDREYKVKIQILTEIDECKESGTISNDSLNKIQEILCSSNYMNMAKFIKETILGPFDTYKTVTRAKKFLGSVERAKFNSFYKSNCGFDTLVNYDKIYEYFRNNINVNQRFYSSVRRSRILQPLNEISSTENISEALALFKGNVPINVIHNDMQIEPPPYSTTNGN